MPSGAEVEPEAPEDYREEKSKVIPVEQHLGLARKIAWKYRSAVEKLRKEWAADAATPTAQEKNITSIQYKGWEGEKQWEK